MQRWLRSLQFQKYRTLLSYLTAKEIRFVFIYGQRRTLSGSKVAASLLWMVSSKLGGSLGSLLRRVWLCCGQLGIGVVDSGLWLGGGGLGGLSRLFLVGCVSGLHLVGGGDVVGGSVDWLVMSGGIFVSRGDLGRDRVMHKSGVLRLGGVCGSGMLRGGRLGCLWLLGRSGLRRLLLVMGLRLGSGDVWVMHMVQVGAVVGDGVVLMMRRLFVLLAVLSQRFEVQVSVHVVTVERLMIELVILSHAVVAMDDGVVVKRAVVSLGNRLMVGGSVDTPAVHGRTILLVVLNGNRSVFNISLVVLNSNRSMLNVLVVDDSDRPVLDIRLVSLDTDWSVLNVLMVDNANWPVLEIGLVLLDANRSVLDVLVVNDGSRSVLDERFVLFDAYGSVLNMLVVDHSSRAVFNEGFVLLNTDRSVLDVLVVNHGSGSVLNEGLVLFNTNGSVLDVLMVDHGSRSVLDERLMLLNTDRSMLNMLVVNDSRGSVLDE